MAAVAAGMVATFVSAFPSAAFVVSYRTIQRRFAESAGESHSCCRLSFLHASAAQTCV
jgi:hypothetical protein